ncbi:MAG: ABC transporter ATP-binding protein, partial [candidate division WOR-3 bacterium]
SELCTNMAIIHEGEVLLTAEPLKAMHALKGKIWSKVIPKKEFPDYRQKFEIVLTRLFAGKIVIHVLSETKPDDTFKIVDPELEDVYFTTINKNPVRVTT